MNRDEMRRGREMLAAQDGETGIETPDIDEETFGKPESEITAAVDVRAYLDCKRRAMPWQIFL